MDRTLGQMVKAKLYRQISHRSIHIHPHKKRKSWKNNISCSQVHLLNLGWFVVYSGIPQMQVHQVVCGALIHCFWGCLEKFPSLLCSQSSRVSALDLDPPLHVGHLRASVLRSDRTGLKEQLLQGLWLTQAGGREGHGVRGEPAAAEACVTLHQPEAHRVFSQGSCPWITGLWRWRAAQVPGGEVWRVTCACIQASWWPQQQP